MSPILDLDVDDDDWVHGERGRRAGVEITRPPTFLCQHHLNHSDHLPNHSDRLNGDTEILNIHQRPDHSNNFCHLINFQHHFNQSNQLSGHSGHSNKGGVCMMMVFIS